MQASNLSYSKSVNPSAGVLLSSAGTDVWTPIPVVTRQGRGGVSNFLPGAETGRMVDSEQTPDAPNLYSGDTCFLPHHHDRVRLEFFVLIMAESRTPYICNNPDMRAVLEAIAARYGEIGGYDVLAQRILWNLLNARSLWRNLARAYGVMVEVHELGTENTLTRDLTKAPLSLDRCDLSLKDAKTAAFAKRIGAALSDRSKALRLRVRIDGTIMPGAEIFPSQGFAENKDDGKLLAKDARGNALVHAQKIGAALRFVDDWYPDAKRVIAAEPYGFDQSLLRCFRLKVSDSDTVGRNFYELLAAMDKAVRSPLFSEATAADLDGDIHYFMSVLLKGGVFANVPGKKKTEKDKADKKKAA